MKILQLYDGYHKVVSGPGIPEVVSRLSQCLVEAGHEVTILERKSLEDEAPVEYIDGIKYVRLESRKTASSASDVIYNFPFGMFRVISDGIRFALKVNRWLAETDDEFDIIHSHFPLATNILITINPGLRRKMVYTFHGDVYRVNLDSRIQVQPWYIRLISPDLFLMRRVSKVVVLNELLSTKLGSSGRLPPQRVVTIPNGMDFDSLDPNIDTGNVKQKYGMDGRCTVLFVGVIIPRKGVEYLVKAANIIVNDFGYKSVLFLLAGSLSLDEAYTRKVSGMIVAYRLEENVKLLGAMAGDDLRRLYAACDISVLTSLEEALASVVTEAMSFTKPVVGTEVGGMLMQIRDGWNGFIVKPADKAALAEKIKYLIDYPEERARMGANSRRWVEENFSWKRVTEKYVKAYCEVQGR